MLPSQRVVVILAHAEASGGVEATTRALARHIRAAAADANAATVDAITGSSATGAKSGRWDLVVDATAAVHCQSTRSAFASFVVRWHQIAGTGEDEETAGFLLEGLLKAWTLSPARPPSAVLAGGDKFHPSYSK